MGFKRARTEEQLKQRQDEIIRACKLIYEEAGYEGLHFKAISERTSFTRPTLYNYYKNKDDILLDILAYELVEWQQELLQVANNGDTLNGKILLEQYDVMAGIITQSLAERPTMLQLLSILFTMLERNCSVDKLAEFKKILMETQYGLMTWMKSTLDLVDDRKSEFFLTSFLSIIIGLYPMTHLTKKQEEAISLAGIDYHKPEFQAYCHRIVAQLLRSMG